MENAVYLSEALFDIEVINAIEVNENSGDPSTVITSIERAYRMLVQVENNNFNRDRYGALLHREGQRGRPSYDISEEQLSFFLEQKYAPYLSRLKLLFSI